MSIGERLGRPSNFNDAFIWTYNYFRSSMIVKDFDRRVFFKRASVFLMIFLLFEYPILHSDAYYRDDYFRALTGINGFNWSGRPLAGIILSIISLHHWALFDFSPLPQILAAMFMAFTLSMFSFRFKMRRELQIIVVFSFIFCNYFFIQDISYRYDSLTITLAVCFSIVPFFFDAYGYIFVFAISFMSAFLTFNTYQPAVNVFIVLAFLFFFYDIKRSGPIRSRQLFMMRIFSSAFAAIAYKLETLLIVPGQYGKIHSALHFSAAVFVRNIVGFFSYIYGISDASVQTELYILLFALMIIYFFIYGLRVVLNKNTAKIYEFSYVVVFFVMIISAFGPMLFLQSPVIAPRIMIGFTVLFFSLCILFLQNSGKLLQKFFVGVLCFLLFSQFSISFAYGNALHLRFVSDRYLAHRILENIYQLSGRRTSILLIKGNAPELPAVENIEKQLPIIKVLSANYLDGGGIGNKWVLRFWSYHPKFPIASTAMDAHNIEHRLRGKTPDGSIVNSLYSMTKFGRYIVVQFKN